MSTLDAKTIPLVAKYLSTSNLEVDNRAEVLASMKLWKSVASVSKAVVPPTTLFNEAVLRKIAEVCRVDLDQKQLWTNEDVDKKAVIAFLQTTFPALEMNWRSDEPLKLLSYHHVATLCAEHLDLKRAGSADRSVPLVLSPVFVTENKTFRYCLNAEPGELAFHAFRLWLDRCIRDAPPENESKPTRDQRVVASMRGCLRAAGKQLLSNVRTCCLIWSHPFGAQYLAEDFARVDVFESLVALASTPYESVPAQGQIAFLADAAVLNGLDHVALLVPIEINDTRGLRKILATCHDKGSLLACGGTVRGICVDAELPGGTVAIKIQADKWDLVVGETALMRVERGSPLPPIPKFDPKEFEAKYGAVFDQRAPPVLVHLVNSATKQHHGTMVVISAKAREEAERLAGQSTLITPKCVMHAHLLLTRCWQGAVSC